MSYEEIKMFGPVALMVSLPILGTAVLPFLLNRIPQFIQDVKARSAASAQTLKVSDESKVLHELQKRFAPIKGQEEAKEAIINIILGWIASKESKHGPKTGGLVLYLTGPSGTGKTMAAEAISKALLGDKAKPVVISLSSIDTSSKESTDQQLFSTKVDAVFGKLKVNRDTQLVNQIKRNPKTVVILNEYDKLQRRDGTLDARLWDIADNGIIKVDGKDIDCSNTIFIVTSNEDPSCLGINKDFDKDESITHVEHEKSFLGRVNVVVFDNPGREQYFEVLNGYVSNILKSYKTDFGIDVSVDKKTIDDLAAVIRTQGRGIRGLRSYVGKVYSAMTRFKIENNCKKSTNGKKSTGETPVRGKLVYNFDKNDFSVEKF